MTVLVVRQGTDKAGELRVAVRTLEGDAGDVPVDMRLHGTARSCRKLTG